MTIAYNLLTSVSSHGRVVFLASANTAVKLGNDWVMCC